MAGFESSRMKVNDAMQCIFNSIIKLDKLSKLADLVGKTYFKKYVYTVNK